MMTRVDEAVTDPTTGPSGEPPMPRTDADRNLLFGINALQNDFITRDALIAAMAAWALAKHRSIGEILVEQNALNPADRDALEAMIARRLAKYDNDPARSLAALSGAEVIAADLQRAIADPEIHASIAHVTSDPHATRAPETVDYIPPHVRYRKVRDHAKGGLGIVYVALDGELKREVALKEIKPEYADNLASQARFLLEAEITGGLEHPGIVPVYGLGAYDDGRPFYAMRFIKGDSLKDAIAAFHADATLKKDPGARTLALQKLLRRFLDVCNAVAYAHSRGVLHRDLKPDNVMVGRYGETLVVDWGLAKAVGRKESDGIGTLPESTVLYPSTGSAETLPGSVVGTPSYMSPEQAVGRLDLLGPTSDVYSLGATLYSLLTGKVPFADRELSDVLKKVERGEFPQPREHAPWLDPALEAIALKAMALRPVDRYDSPKGLADDVERWLADEPVAAYPEPFARRAGRWARKHRTSLTTATAATLVTGLLIGIFFAQRSAERWRIDLSAIAIMDESARLASQAQAGDSTLWEKAAVVAQRAVDQLEAGGSPGRLREARATLEAIRAESRLIKALEEARLQSANVKDSSFDSQARIDGYLAAFRAYGIDVATLPIEDAARRIRSSRVADDLIATLDDWVRPWANITMIVPADRLAAIARAAETDAIRANIREAASRRDVVTLRQLCEREDDRRKLGPRIRFLFDSLLSLDPEESFPLLETILREHPSDFWLNHDLGRAYENAKSPKLAEAIHFLSIAVALRPDSPGVHVNLGFVLRDQGHLDRAVAEFEEAIRLKSDLALAHDNLGIALRGQGHLDRAVAEFEAAIRLKPDYADPHSNLGAVLEAQGHLDRAVAEYESAIRLNPHGAEAHLNLALAMKAQGRLDRAVAEYEAAIRLKPDLADAHCALGSTLLSMGKFAAALESLEKGHALGSKQPGWRYPSEGWVQNARRLVDLEAKLPALLKGEATPKDLAERLALADLCYQTGRYVTSARFWGEAFAETPALADDLSKGNRYNAACSASLAASGKGKDEPMPDDATKVKLRELALGWLRADLAAWGKILEAAKEPALKQAVVGTLAHWKEDTDLAGIRDEAGLAKLPEGEREGFRTLWADVEVLRKKAGGL
jgi:serine/threonine protein kinase/tetratricopeptide (TPR) repeat protein